ncbi:MAG: inositol monophosphatase [Deltaproteobacteria bacterium]|nr:inositol monophosphatase [Deltaproteobacteria bacterium]
MRQLLQVALKAAEAGAAVLAQGYGKTMEISFKGDKDLVTQYDLASETAIRKVLEEFYPDHSVLAEESGLSGKGDGYRWYIDPLDGTTNFSKGRPFFAVSLGCCKLERGAPTQPLVGVVWAPILREVFFAGLSSGAFVRRDELGGRLQEKLCVSATSNPMEAVVDVGFPCDFAEKIDELMAPIARVAQKVRAVRLSGSAALDLAYVAGGRSECYWENGLKPWDTAAGQLLVTEAGGVVSDLTGAPYRLERSGGILASNARLHPWFKRNLAA